MTTPAQPIDEALHQEMERRLIGMIRMLDGLTIDQAKYVLKETARMIEMLNTVSCSNMAFTELVEMHARKYGESASDGTEPKGSATLN